ncbi:hypothetical protein GGI35DRAFT_461073 [Trichoderma velutinum]
MTGARTNSFITLFLTSELYQPLIASSCNYATIRIRVYALRCIELSWLSYRLNSEVCGVAVQFATKSARRGAISSRINSGAYNVTTIPCPDLVSRRATLSNG